MKKLFLVFFSVLNYFSAVSQIDSATYGISALTQGTGLFFSKLNISDGNVVQISANAVDHFPAGNGRTIDPLHHLFYYTSDSVLLAFELKTGEMIRKVPITNYLNSTFHGIQYNYQDSTLYGIAVNAADQDVKLGKLDPYSGSVTPVSAGTVASGYSLLAGTALDAVHGIYYFETIKTPANHLLGVDIQSGELVSDVLIGIDSGERFGPIAYNCHDSTLYGLAGNYSNGRKLARIDPHTGAVTLLSKLIIADTILNEQATIDPFQKVFYFDAIFQGSSVTYRGVDLKSGDMVVFSFINPIPGTYLTGFIYNHACYFYSPSSVDEKKKDDDLIIFPNPVTDRLTIRSINPMFRIEIIDFTGKTVFIENCRGLREVRADVTGYPEGIYLVRIKNETSIASYKIIKTSQKR